MGKMPLLSIVIPVYNVQEYLSDSLNSVIGQIKTNDVEVIIVNDGSTDGSLQIAERFVEMYTFVKVVSIENSGLGAARNVGVQNANGMYVQFLDSDDVLSETIIEEVLFEIKRDMSTDVFVFDYAEFPDGDLSNTRKQYFDLSKFRYGNVAWNKIYRLDFWRAYDFNYPEGMRYEDTPLTHIIMGLSEKSTKINTIGYLYRRNREGSITAESSVMVDFLCRLNSLREFELNILKYRCELQSQNKEFKVVEKFLKEVLLVFWNNKNILNNKSWNHFSFAKRLLNSPVITKDVLLRLNCKVLFLYLIEKIMFIRRGVD